MSQKQVSIIIPCFNREILITESLTSVLQQTYSNWECIVVDDGSTDATVESIKKFSKNDSRFRLVNRNRKPKGAPTCRNIGISNVNGDFFMFLDSDDILQQDCLENRLLIAKNYPNFDAWVFPSQFIHHGNLINKYFYREDSATEKAIAFLLRPQWPINGPLFNTEKFKSKLTFFHEEMPFWQDWEFHINCILSGITFLQTGLTKPDIFIRVHQDPVRINYQKVFETNEIATVYDILFSIHSKLIANADSVVTFFKYRMLYLFAYLIYREGSVHLSPGLEFLENHNINLDMHYKALNFLAINSKNHHITNKLIASLYSIANKKLLHRQLSKLPN